MTSIRGLAAATTVGSLIVAGEALLNGALLADEWVRANAALGLTRPSLSISILALLKLFILGFFVVWLYLAIRPKFGPGPRTAAIAGAYVAVLIWIWVLLGLFMAGYVTVTIAWVTALWGLVEVPLASVLGIAILEKGFRNCS